MERWTQALGLDDAAAEAVRADARERVLHIFNHPGEVFQPWEQ